MKTVEPEVLAEMVCRLVVEFDPQQVDRFKDLRATLEHRIRAQGRVLYDRH